MPVVDTSLTTIPLVCSQCGAVIHEARIAFPLAAGELLALLRRVAGWHECPDGDGWEAVLGRPRREGR